MTRADVPETTRHDRALAVAQSIGLAYAHNLEMLRLADEADALGRDFTARECRRLAAEADDTRLMLLAIRRDYRRDALAVTS